MTLQLDRRLDVGGDDVRLWSHGEGTWAAPPGAHAGDELAWIETGAIQYTVGRETITLGAGDAVWVPRGTPHVTSFHGPSVAGAVELPAEVVDTLARAAHVDAARAKPQRVVGAPVAVLGRLVRAECERHAAGHLDAIAAMIRAMAITALRAAPPRTAPPPTLDPRVAAVTELIQRRFAEPIGVDDFAQSARASRFHLSRLFRDALGISPYQYLIKVRVERAAERLRRSDASVTEVAFDVGFQDLGRFARAFRAQVGEAPAAYARRARDARPTHAGTVDASPRIALG